MSDCRSIDQLIPAYVDNELDPTTRDLVERHLAACPPCRGRATVEQSVQRLMTEQRPLLCGDKAPASLRMQCDRMATLAAKARVPARSWMPRARPLAMAAMLVLVVGGAFLYPLTVASSRVMSAELTADHMKCFAIAGMTGARQTAQVVEGSLAADFGWNAHLPERPDAQGLELVGMRPCLYGEGRAAHIMYRHNGQPLSLFMLPRDRGEDRVMDVLGHRVEIWSDDNRTFVLVASEARSEIHGLASFVRASMH